MHNPSSARQNNHRQDKTPERQSFGFENLRTNLTLNINDIQKNQGSNGESRVERG